MSVTVSDNSIVLIENHEILKLLREILQLSSIKIFSGNNSLSSASSLAAKLNEDGNLSFLKTDTLRFIKDYGYPFITVIEIKNGSTDKYRVLKNLLLSWIIIIQNDQYKNIFCNLLILLDSSEYNIFKETYKQPQSILNMIKTGDDRINSIIRDYAVNNDKFKKNFNILVTDIGREISLIRSEFILFINMIKAREKLLSKLAVEKKVTNAGPKTGAAEAADVVIRIGRNLYKNGDSIDRYNESTNMSEKEIFIFGNFTSYTRLKVNERLLKMIKHGFGEDFSFKKTDPIIINIPPSSTIDSTVPITLTQMLSQELKDYKNIRIKTPPEHYKIMQESKGFTLIQKSLIIHEF